MRTVPIFRSNFFPRKQMRIFSQMSRISFKSKRWKSRHDTDTDKLVVCRSTYKALVIGRLLTSIPSAYCMIDNKLLCQINTVGTTAQQLRIPGCLPPPRRYWLKRVGKKKEEKMVWGERPLNHYVSITASKWPKVLSHKFLNSSTGRETEIKEVSETWQNYIKCWFGVFFF